MTNQKLSLLKKAVYAIIFLASILISVELITSTALIYLYRLKNVCISNHEISLISTTNFIYKAAMATLQFAQFAGLCPQCQVPVDRRIDANPSPFYRSDSVLGYRPEPGSHTITYSKKDRQQWRKLRVKVTINADGSRWTRNWTDPNKPSLFIFGDSFLFGEGVNDEQTFSFLLQQAMPNFNVRLFAAGGYSLTQAFLNFDRLKAQISDRDTIILGYADFYDRRHVLAPSWLRTLQQGARAWGVRTTPGLLPKASVDANGVVSFSYIQQDCSLNKSYCKQPDPTEEEMKKVTVALANQIANNTSAKLYLLYFQGVADNPVLQLLSKRFALISALPSDFDYQIRDDIMGYDGHPGPYWHYAIFRKLRAVLRGQ